MPDKAKSAHPNNELASLSLVVLDEIDALVSLSNEVRHASIKSLLLESRELSVGENFLNTFLAEANLQCTESIRKPFLQ